MLVTRTEIKNTLGVGDKTVAKYLKPFMMQRVLGVVCYDVNKNFILELKDTVMECMRTAYHIDDKYVHQYSLDIINNILLEWERVPTYEFAITSEDIRNLFSLTLLQCEKLLSSYLNSYMIRRLPKTYQCSTEFLDKLVSRAKVLDIDLDSKPLDKLHKLLVPNTSISHKTHSWTKDMLMCKHRGCKCEGCFFENFFTPYDPNFGLSMQSPRVCNIKGYVQYAVEHGIPESRVSTYTD